MAAGLRAFAEQLSTLQSSLEHSIRTVDLLQRSGEATLPPGTAVVPACANIPLHIL